MVHHAALEISIVAAADEILRVVAIGEVKALHVKIEFKDRGGFARETGERNPGGGRGAGTASTYNMNRSVLREQSPSQSK